MTTQVLVKRYLRRHPQTPKRTIETAIRTLRRQKEDGDFEHICGVQWSNGPSQVSPSGGNCSMVNIEPRDRKNVVRAAFTTKHEGIHARYVARHGWQSTEGEVGLRHEIDAHKETISFGERWLKKERSAKVRNQIREELAIEHQAVHALSAQLETS